MVYVHIKKEKGKNKMMQKSSLKIDQCLPLQGDADIFFPTDFCLLENIDHYCSGWLKPTEAKPLKKGKKRRTLMVILLLQSERPVIGDF